MLTGWEYQQLGGRNLRRKTVRQRLNIIRRFVQFTNEYPWDWTAAHVDEWMMSIVSEHGNAKTTIRNYQGTLRAFCDYITSPHYEWPDVCDRIFGNHPAQVCHEWNTVAHLLDYEGSPGRRPATREELQLLFDYSDAQVERALTSGRKGALRAYRDATIFKTLYGWGFRCGELSKLDLTDLHSNSHSPEFGKYGVIQIRWGKASNGSPPKRRAVLSVMPWAVDALADYVENVRPLLGYPNQSALWVTERGFRVQPREIDERFASYRDDLGLSKELSPHCLRHSYITHLIEEGADEKFVQDQVGHRFASTTGIYTAVSGDFMNKMMRKAVDRALHSIGDSEEREK
ncbi:MAG: tyrosine-type recombinase/integrase [Mycobacterium sp.]